MSKSLKRKRAEMKTAKKKAQSDYDQCDRCRRHFLKENLFIGPDPYVQDIFNEDVDCCLCSKCYSDTCDDI